MIFIIVTAILALDQFTKFLASKNLFLNQSIPVISQVFHFTLIHNKGAAFGILKERVPLFIIASTLAIILLYLNIKKHRKTSLYSISLGLILSGALGNLIDRLFLGYVIDFLDFRIWPVFNIADSAITVGAILLGWSMIRKA